MTKNLLLSCLVGFLGIFLCSGLDAEIVRLSGGQWLQGEIVEHDEKQIVLERWDTGGVVTIQWSRVVMDDRKRLQRKLGYILEEDLDEKVDGMRLFLVDSRVLEGVPLEKGTDSEVLRLKTSSGVLRIERSRIRTATPIQLIASEIYSGEELYRQQLKGLNPKSAQDHYRLCEYLIRLGNVEKALEHLWHAIQIDPSYEERYAERASLLNEEIQRRAIESRFTLILSKAKAKRFDEADADLAALVGQFQEDPSVLTRDPALVTEEIQQMRNAYLQKQVFDQMISALRSLAGKAAGKRGVTYDEAKSYAEGTMGEEAKRVVAAKLKIEEQEVESFFEERTKKKSFRVSFGSGSFLVGTEGTSKEDAGGEGGDALGLSKDIDEIKKLIEKMGGPKLQTGRSRGGSQGGSGGSGGQSESDLKDLWFRAASRTSRSNLMLGLYAIQHLQVERNLWTPCSSCAGKGVRVHMVAGSSTGTRHRVCTRCRGMRYDRTVVFK